MKINEDGVTVIGGSPTNNVGDGVIAGLGINNKNLPNQGEPGKRKKKSPLTFKEFLKRRMPI